MKLEQVKEGDLVVDKLGNTYKVLNVERGETELPVRVQLVSINPQYKERESFHNFLHDFKESTPNNVGDEAWIYHALDAVKSAIRGLGDLGDDDLICLENLEPLYTESNVVRGEAPCDDRLWLSKPESIKRLTSYELMSILAMYQCEAHRRGLKLSIESVE